MPLLMRHSHTALRQEYSKSTSQERRGTIGTHAGLARPHTHNCACGCAQVRFFNEPVMSYLSDKIMYGAYVALDDPYQEERLPFSKSHVCAHARLV